MNDKGFSYFLMIVDGPVLHFLKMRHRADLSFEICFIPGYSTIQQNASFHKRLKRNIPLSCFEPDEEGGAFRAGFNADPGLMTGGDAVADGQTQAGAGILGSKKGCAYFLEHFRRNPPALVFHRQDCTII